MMNVLHVQGKSVLIHSRQGSVNADIQHDGERNTLPPLIQVPRSTSFAKMWWLQCTVHDIVQACGHSTEVRLTRVESRAARVISKLPFRPSNAGIKINSSETWTNTSQRWKLTQKQTNKNLKTSTVHPKYWNLKETLLGSIPFRVLLDFSRSLSHNLSLLL